MPCQKILHLQVSMKYLHLLCNTLPSHFPCLLHHFINLLRRICLGFRIVVSLENRISSSLCRVRTCCMSSAFVNCLVSVCKRDRQGRCSEGVSTAASTGPGALRFVPTAVLCGEAMVCRVFARLSVTDTNVRYCVEFCVEGTCQRCYFYTRPRALPPKTLTSINDTLQLRFSQNCGICCRWIGREVG